MEAMACDEMDEDHRQKSGREKLEDTLQDQIRAKEQEIGELKQEIKELREDMRAKEHEIRGVEKEIACASGSEVSVRLEAKLQFLRQQISSRDQQISSRDQQINSRDQQLISLREELRSLRSSQEASASAAELKDRSEDWITHMLLPQVPELPRNRADLTSLLFPLEQHQKLPVTKEFYGYISRLMPKLAAEVLVQADGSRLPSAVSQFLLSRLGHVVTEMQTTLLVAGSFSLFFDVFDAYSMFRFGLELAFNSTEKRRHSYSQSTVPRSRPDTIAVASGCTFLVGEDKVDNLHAAEADLRSKMRPLNKMFYGDLNFILGYIAAGAKFRWIYLGKNGSKDLHLIGRCLDLSNIRDRCTYLLSLGYAFQLLKKMADSVPDVPGRRAMFSVEESPDKKRKLYFYADKVAKHIRDFDSHCDDQETSLSEIRRAYGVAQGCPFLLQAVNEPTVSARGTYRVECTPLGYSCILKSEQDCRWMARCVCQALCILHNAGLVHRDIRLANIVRLSETGFMLIDLESVANSPFSLDEGFRHFSGWHPKMFEGNQYTPFSDMYSLGELLGAALPYDRTSLAEDFVRKLTNKQLSASDALQDPWLSELML